MRKGKVYIGTSGWHYKHWKGTFYPGDIKEADQFDYYKRYFSTVEINNSFYRLPDASTFDTWRKQSPRSFVFAVKASRFITHMKKLKIDKKSISIFFSRTKWLKNKEGPILFQLPPKWKINAQRLDDFIKILPPKKRYVFEFRDATWYHESVYEVLRRHRCAFCIYELEYHQSPIEVTARFVYVRLHGPGNKYQGSYPTATLRTWAKHCRSWQKKGLDVYIYFDNDQAGYAAFNAQELIKMLG
jgi:uncharacterized protein YecE (DUF72 family)